MNLHDLFEKKANSPDDNEHEQSIDIRDPATKWLVKKARSKYAYAETDLEAFVKFMQDEVNAEKENIQTNTDDIGTEHDVNVHQEKVNDSQARHIKELEKVVDKFDNIRKDMDMKIDKMDRATLDQGMVQIGR